MAPVQGATSLSTGFEHWTYTSRDFPILISQSLVGCDADETCRNYGADTMGFDDDGFLRRISTLHARIQRRGWMEFTI